MHAGIVGAGIMGRVLALALLRAGWKVTIFDAHADNTTNCSAIAAGLLTPISELDKAEKIIFDLGNAAIHTHWPTILQQLPTSIYFQQTGSIVIHHPRDHMEWSQFDRRIQQQLPRHDYAQTLDKTALTQLEPELSKFHRAYYFPQEAQIDSQALLPALHSFLHAQGVTWHTNTPVTHLQADSIVVNDTTHTFDMTFDCRGLGAKSILTDLRSVRGELIWLHAPDVHLQRPIRLLHPRYSLYIAPRPNNVYLVGASEIETEDCSTISVRTTLELLTAAYSVHAGFAEARIMKTATHCRPTLPHHLPRILCTPRSIAVNGLYRHGYLIAPSLANEIVHYLQTGAPSSFYASLWVH